MMDIIFLGKPLLGHRWVSDALDSSFHSACISSLESKALALDCKIIPVATKCCLNLEIFLQIIAHPRSSKPVYIIHNSHPHSFALIHDLLRKSN